jgi:uncharacterized protein (TIGR03435 family)
MNGIVDVAGWTLIHFLWQGALAALLAAAGLRILRLATPQARYATACAALAFMLIAPAVTARIIWHEAERRPTGATVLLPGGHPPGAAIGTFVPQTAASSGRAPTPSAPSMNATTARGLLPSLVAVWLAGVGGLLVRLTRAWWRVRRLHRQSLACTPSPWHSAAATLAARLGLGRHVHVVDSPHADTPLVIGWLQPVILLPVAALTNLTPAQVNAILAHELAHVRRHDFLVNLLQAVAETMLFYHPAVWWLSARIRTEREHCCDAVAVETSGDPLGYAEALTALETWRMHRAQLAVAATSGSLMERVRRIIGLPPDTGAPVIGTPAVVGALVMLFVGVAGVQYLRAAQPLADDSATETAAAAGVTKAWRIVFDHPSGELTLRGFTGRDLIRFAHDVPAARVIGGPSWLDEESLDLSTTLDEDPGAAGIRAVVRQILERRMGLTTHVETRNFPALALVIAGGPAAGLRPATTECVDVPAWLNAGNRLRDLGARRPCGSWEDRFSSLKGVSVTIPELADEIEQNFRASLGGLEIVDRTDRTGTFDIELQMSPLLALAGHFHIPGVKLPGVRLLPAEMQEQLGLTIEPTTAPYEVIVIGNVHRPVN